MRNFHLKSVKISLFGDYFLVTAALGLGVACQDPPREPARKAIPSARITHRADAPARSKIEALLKRDERRERDEPPEVASAGPSRIKVPWIVDDLVDVAPAGPAAATSEGVALVTRDKEVKLAPLSHTSAGPRAAPTPIAALDADPKDFIARARGPAVVGKLAYWIDGSQLVRRAVAGGALEILANDARAFTQVAGTGDFTDGAPALVAYIAVSSTDTQSLHARLWSQGQGSRTLSPEGTSANTVALVARGPSWMALTLEARTGMSPLHARMVSLTAAGPQLGPDTIAWVAGSAQPMTMIHGIGDDKDTWAILPIERDISRFGLARVHVDESPNPNQEITWRDYPNGIDPAPAATGHLCGKLVAIYARPMAAAPRSPQELHLAAVTAAGLGPSTLIGTSRGFSDVSLASLESGALLVYVADHRTWARRIRCTR